MHDEYLTTYIPYLETDIPYLATDIPYLETDIPYLDLGKWSVMLLVTQCSLIFFRATFSRMQYLYTHHTT